MIAGFALGAEPGIRDQSENGGDMAEASGCRGSEDRSPGNGFNGPVRNRRSDGCDFPATHFPAAGRMHLCVAAHYLTSDTLSAVSLSSASWDFTRPFTTSGRHQRRDPLPFLVRHVRRIALRLASDPGHQTPLLRHPHPELESYLDDFPNRLTQLRLYKKHHSKPFFGRMNAF